MVPEVLKVKFPFTTDQEPSIPVMLAEPPLNSSPLPEPPLAAASEPNSRSY